MKRAVLIVNPSSGTEQAPTFAELAATKLRASFSEVELRYTEQGGDATRFAREAAESGVHSVFVMGGDGTVSEGINGLAEQAHRPHFGVFPLGTVNDLARTLGISLDPAEAIAAFDIGRVRPLDIGKVNHSYFSNVVAVGMIPEAINKTSIADKSRLGVLAYVKEGLLALTNYEAHQYSIVTEDERRSFESSLLLIGSIGSIAGIDGLIPAAEPDDGLLHLIYVKDSSTLQTLRAVPELLRGVSESNPTVGYLTFRKARLEWLGPSSERANEDNSDRKPHANVDGDPGDELPLNLELLEKHIDVYY